ncbi:hypothetical protein ACH5RR_024560 [Cinchona calisaya]|uniref:Uncharacterized protein n=1 Tax=Cinchona calisaya TaxID=153742 RepID=A0ABD2YX28_9GENT
MDAYVVGITLISESVEAIFSLNQDLRLHFHGVEKILGMAFVDFPERTRLELSARFCIIFFTPLFQSELEHEHEQLDILRLLHLHFLLGWKREACMLIYYV